MAFVKLDNAIYNSTINWPNEVRTKNILKKGWCNVEFNSSTTIQAGSSIDIDGLIYYTNTYILPTGSIPNGTNYVRVSSTTVEHTTTVPTWDDERKGWYSSGLKRYILQFEYNSGSTSNKRLMTNKPFDEYAIATQLDELDDSVTAYIGGL